MDGDRGRVHRDDAVEFRFVRFYFFIADRKDVEVVAPADYGRIVAIVECVIAMLHKDLRDDA